MTFVGCVGKTVCQCPIIEGSLLLVT